MRMIVKNFHLPEEMIDGLEKLAKREDKPVSRIVRAALADHLEKARAAR